MDGVWKMIRRSEGEETRVRIGELRDLVKRSWESLGARDGLVAFGRAHHSTAS